MHNRAVLLLVAFICFFQHTPVLAGEIIDDKPEIVTEYAHAKRLMRQGEFLQASRLFLQLSGRYPNSPNKDIFLFNRAKSDLYFGNYSEASAGFSNFISRFPHSQFLAHAYFFLSNIDYLRGRLDRSVAGYIEAYRISQDTRLDDLIISSLTSAISQAKSVTLGEADFAGLDDIIDDRKCTLILPVTEALVKIKSFESAQRLITLCGKELDPNAIVEAQSVGLELEIGMVLPFSGDLQIYGEEIEQGAVIAAELYRQETGNKLSIIPYDTKGNPINAARIIKELINSNIDAVVGPLTSEEAAVASASLGCGTLPLIAPAATQAGLTLLSESVFQLAPNIELQGRQAAEYAVLVRQADTAVIITPTGSDDLLRSRTFAERFEELGGTLLAIEYYRTRDKDFGKQILDVKKAIFGIQRDSAVFINEYGDTLDYDILEANVDCLYLPGSPDQLRLLLPQLNFYNLKGFLLGSDGWGDDAIYRLGDKITRGGVFPSPFLHRQTSQEYLKFASAYDKRYGKQPLRLASLGYDAVKTITEVVIKGATTRQEIITELGHIKGYQGAAATVTFGKYRENIELPLYQLVDGQPVYIGEGAQVEQTGSSQEN